MNKMKLFGGSGGMVVGLILLLAEKLGIPVTPDIADYIGAVVCGASSVALYKVEPKK